MQHQQYVHQSLSQPIFLLLTCLVDEPKTVIAWQELSGMAVVRMLTGVWLVDLWDVLPLLNSVFPGLPVQLVPGFVLMVGALVTALIALVRSIVTLRGLSAAANNPSSLPERDRTDRKSRVMVLSVGLFLFTGLMMSSFVLHLMPTRLLFIPLVAVLGSIIAALAVKQYKRYQDNWVH